MKKRINKKNFIPLKEWLKQGTTFPNKNDYILSIDIGTTYIKLAVIKKEASNIQLIDSHFLPASETSLLPTAEIIHILKTINKEYKGILNNVYINISGKNSYSGIVTFPSIDKKEIKDAIKWKIKDAVSFSTEDAIFKYRILDSQSSHTTIRVLVVGMSRELSDEIVNIVNNTGMYIRAIYPTSISLENLVQTVPEIKKDYVAVLDMGGKESEINMFVDGELKFRRKIPVTSYRFTREMTGKFVVKNEQKELTMQKAEKIKKSVGFPPEKRLQINGIPYSKIRAMLRPQLERLITEIRQSFELFEEKIDKSSPKILLLSGGGGRLKNLDSVLKKEFSCDVKKFPLPTNINFDSALKNSYLQLLPSIGSLLKLTPMNLLPKQLQIEKVKRIAYSSFKIGLISVLVLLLLFFLNLEAKEKYYLDRLEELSWSTQNMDKIESMYKYIQRVGNITGSLTKDSQSLYLILKTLSDIIPESIYIQELNFTNSENTMSLKGEVSFKESDVETKLLNFRSELEKKAFIKKADLKKIRRSSNGEKKASFKLIAKLE